MGPWFDVEAPREVDLSGPGIYLWRIGGEPCYVGKATSLGSRLAEHGNNVRKLPDGQPYRKGNPDGFRRVHRALAEARTAGERVVFRVMERCEPGEPLLARERHWIAVIRPPLSGPSRPVGGR